MELAARLVTAFDENKIVKRVDRKLADIELSRCEIEDPVALDNSGLSRVLSYPVSEPKSADTERTDFGHGLMERLNSDRHAEAVIAVNLKRLRGE